MGCLSIQTSPLTCSSTKTFISLAKYWTSKSLPPTMPNPFDSPNKNANSWTLKACPYDWNMKITWKLAPSKPHGTKMVNIGYSDPSTKITYLPPLQSTLSWNQDPIKTTNHIEKKTNTTKYLIPWLNCCTWTLKPPWMCL